jgi:hypothetical protein
MSYQVSSLAHSKVCAAADRERQSQDGHLIAWRNAAQSKNRTQKKSPGKIGERYA